MKRREAIIHLAMLLLATANSYGRNSRQDMSTKPWKSFLKSGGVPPVRVFPKLDFPNSQWRRSLPDLAYKVLFEEHTEPKFSSPLNDEERKGIYKCRACALPLFTSEMKYDSGTGWPSFFTCIPDHIDTKIDYKIFFPRTEYHCKKCGGHQGHVFEDGPEPTYERWCNNGISLNFVASD